MTAKGKCSICGKVMYETEDLTQEELDRRLKLLPIYCMKCAGIGEILHIDI
jgi:hypothetical protein